ncbi:MAG: hypothetical protein H7Y38_13590 [Armatimonadetes bacterium]|nr:hypothetical protein [Armatimonadota bacterium]
MTSSSILFRRALVAAFAVTVANTIVPAFAHEAPCPRCRIKLTQNTPTQDNEVVLRLGRKRIEYKCVYCAMADVAEKYGDADVTILAPSEKKGQPVELTRTAGKWNAPEGTVFVGVKASHAICQVTYRTFTNKAAFDTYVAANKAKLPGAKPLTLDQMLTLAMN